MGIRTVVNICPGCGKQSTLVRLRHSKRKSQVRLTEHPIHIDCLIMYRRDNNGND